MKTLENHFEASVQLRNVGDHVVAAKVSMSLRLDYIDSIFVSGRILDELIPRWVEAHPLYDGSFVIVSNDPDFPASNTCVSGEVRSFADIEAVVGLDDGLTHPVCISLNQSDDAHCDYTVSDTRFILLRGKIAAKVDDDEKVAE